MCGFLLMSLIEFLLCNSWIIKYCVLTIVSRNIFAPEYQVSREYIMIIKTINLRIFLFRRIIITNKSSNAKCVMTQIYDHEYVLICKLFLWILILKSSSLINVLAIFSISFTVLTCFCTTFSFSHY